MRTDEAGSLKGADHEAFRTHTPIVALTANAMVDDRSATRRAGMDGFLVKPVRARSLQVRLDLRCLDGASAEAAFVAQLPLLASARL